MGHIERIVGNLVRDLSTSIRKFTAFIFLVFTVGIIFGFYVAQLGDPFKMQLAFSIPLLLALLSYFFTEIAIAFFLLFVILLFFL